MRRSLARRITALSIGLLAMLSIAIGATRPDEKDRDKDRPETPVEVYEWSIWVGNPAQTTINTTRIYKSAMAGSVGSSRPNIDDKDRTIRFPVAPISIVQFFGEPAKDVDVDLRLKKGTFLAHWPRSAERSGRLQWFKSDLTTAPPADLPLNYLTENHWMHRLRDKEKALYLKHEAHADRFIAYDAELGIPVPVKIRGGPDAYTLQNLTNRKLLDVAVIAPSESGYRVGWLDALPSAVPEPADEAEAKDAGKTEQQKKQEARKKADAKKSPDQKAQAVFDEADAAAKEKKKAEEDELPPIPAEGDATMRARVDQVMNRSIQVNAEGVPRKNAIAMIASQARIRYELDDKSIARAEIDMNEPTTLRAPSIAARDAMAEVLGGAGLSYRVTDDGRLFITTAARLAEADKKERVIEGPPVKLIMSTPRQPFDPTYRDMTRVTMVRRLVGQGLREDLANFLLDQYGPQLFEPKELVVLVHLSRPALDEAVTLDVFPAPKKLARTVTIVVHGIDPRLQDRARGLVKLLGEKSSHARDQAEERLFEMGPAAVPVLEDALSNKDVEIVYRAERLLLKLGRSVP